MIFTKGQNSFIPRGKVDDLINVDVVKRELDFLPEATIPHDSSTDDLARIICGEGSHKPVYRKIFALLTWKKNLGAIFQFLDEGVSDKDLPLKPYDTQGKPLEDSHFRVHRNNHPTQIVSCFGGWADRKIKEFLRCQWTVLSPFLVLGDATNIQHHEFHNDVILPFQPLYPETELVRMSGGFAVVNKVQVHPDHYRLEGQATNSEKVSQVSSCCRCISAAYQNIPPTEKLVRCQEAVPLGSYGPETRDRDAQDLCADKAPPPHLTSRHLRL